MIQDPADDVAAFLAAAGIGLIRPPGDGANLFTGQVRASSPGQVPQAAVFVMDDDGGGTAEPYLGAGEVDDTVLRITVRGPAATRGATRTLARTIRAALQRAVVPGYFSCWVPQALPKYMGQDDEQCSLFELDVELQWTSG